MLRIRLLCSGSRRFLRCNRQHHCEQCAAWSGGRLYVPSVFFQDGFADAQSQPSTASRALCCVEGIEDMGQDFGRNARAIVLERRPDKLFMLATTDPERPFPLAFPHCLFSIENKVQKDLHQLPWFTDCAG